VERNQEDGMEGFGLCGIRRENAFVALGSINRNDFVPGIYAVMCYGDCCGFVGRET